MIKNIIYYFENPAFLSEKAFADFLEIVPQGRREKVDRLRFMKDKKQSLVAYLLLMYAVREQTGRNITGEKFTFSAKGKPSFEGEGLPFFNLSHCERCVACIVSASPVGVDVQNYKPGSMGGIGSVLTENEKIFCHGADEEKKFARIWTLKESFLKLTGDGITGDIKSLDFSPFSEDSFMFGDTFVNVYEHDDYYISACSSGGFVDSVRRISEGDLTKIFY